VFRDTLQAIQHSVNQQGMSEPYALYRALILSGLATVTPIPKFLLTFTTQILAYATTWLH
jgi:flagellar biosynthesis component FlhA